MNTINTPPSTSVFSYTTEPKPVDMYDHQCMCEKCFSYPFKTQPSRSTTDSNCCCVNCSELCGSLKTDCNGREDCCSTSMCLPIKLPFILLFGLPFTVYNISRNYCKNTSDKNYLC